MAIQVVDGVLEDIRLGMEVQYIANQFLDNDNNNNDNDDDVDSNCTARQFPCLLTGYSLHLELPSTHKLAWQPCKNYEEGQLSC